MLVDEPAEERVAGGRILSAHLRKLGQGGEELLGELDEALVVRGGEPREHNGIVPDPVASCPALLDPRLQGEAEGGQHGHQDQEHEAPAKTRRGQARHPFFQCRPLNVELPGPIHLSKRPG